jgi:hypothetical protein
MRREITNQLLMYAVAGLSAILIILAVPVLSWLV